MIPDILEAAIKAIAVTALGALLLLLALCTAAHVHDTWNAPAYPHSGFCPDCPAWDADRCEL